MRKVNLSAIDLNLLPPLNALLEHRNITRAAQACGLSQPAMSRALARLRDLFDDALLVRVAKGYALTPRAERLKTELEPLVHALTALLNSPQLNPLEAERTVRLVGSDAQAVLLMPKLQALLAQEAPKVTVQMLGYSTAVPEQFLRREVDFAFALRSTPLASAMRSETLGFDDMALITAKGRSISGLEAYAKARHATVSIFSDGVSEIDAVLARHGLSRSIALTTPYFVAALAAVGQSDLVSVLSRRLAESYAEPFGLALSPPPFALPVMEPCLIWHRLSEADPLLMWLRDRIVAVARGVYAQSPPLSPLSKPSSSPSS